MYGYMYLHIISYTGYSIVYIVTSYRLYIYIYIHHCSCICMYVNLCIYIYICICMYIYIYTHTHTTGGLPQAPAHRAGLRRVIKLIIN